MRFGIIILVVAMTNIAVKANTGKRLRAEYFGLGGVYDKLWF